MAIQNRRGVYSDFTPSKMVPGELAVVQSGDPNNTSGKAVYAAFGASGDVKRLATEDDLGSVDTALGNKVDKVSGKGLSANDYTNTEKTKLAGIASGAEVNVQSDWTQTDSSSDDYIKNKPTLGTAAAKDVGVANGVAGLDGAGKVSSSQLPSYVDDVIEGYYYNGAFYSDSAHTTPITAETGKIYVDLSTDTTYRWTGNIYVQISNPIDIDATLTQQGKAADAKATGDAIAQSGKVNTVNSIQPDSNKNVQTVVELTQAQYDALATKDPNVVYYITDGSVDYPTASTIPYDNTDSGLTANNVQDAIDEEQSQIDTLNSNPSNVLAFVAGKLSANQKLATAYCIVNMGDPILNIGNAFTITSDGGFKPSLSCTVRITGYIRITGLTAGDVINLAYGVYSSGSWANEGYAMRITAPGSELTLPIEYITFAPSSGNIYLRAANQTASRGTINYGQCMVERLALS